MGPLPTTIHAFWRMVWHDECFAIVMTTNTEENGRTKCERYWPEGQGETNAMTVEDFTIILESVHQCDGYTRSILKLTRGNESRPVVHFWYVDTTSCHMTPVHGRSSNLLSPFVCSMSRRLYCIAY